MRRDNILQRGLKRWQQLRLQAIEERMHDITEDYRDASNGLELARSNPGEIAPDIVSYLWDQLNNCATELGLLEEEHQGLLEMDLPHLIITFKRERKDTACRLPTS